MPREDLLAELRRAAFALPDAWEDHPWGESVAKVGKKVFVFFGMSAPGDPVGFTVKLPRSGEEALSLPFTVPAGYGLDRGGWVTVTAPPDAPPEMLVAWIEESYRAVAPKRLVAGIDWSPK
jgi:predicted DNA-binding protein (MmcQ/YjbR family)